MPHSLAQSAFPPSRRFLQLGTGNPHSVPLSLSPCPQGQPAPIYPRWYLPPNVALSMVHASCAAETANSCVSMFVECWSIHQKGAWVNQTGQELWRHGFHQTWGPYICLFSIVLSHLFCSLPGLLDSEKVRGPPWTPCLYAYPSVIVIAVQSTFSKACSWYFSMANVKC